MAKQCNEWSKDGSFKRVWIALLAADKSNLDLSSIIQIVATHLQKKEGAAVGYQGRKSCKKTTRS